MKKRLTLDEAKLQGGLRVLTWLQKQIEIKENELMEELLLLPSTQANLPTAQEMKGILK